MSNLDFDLAESLTTTNASYFIFIYIIVLIYCCFGLAVVCDVYFVPALQKLSHRYDLSPDIAGSTLMALGASVPELFASLIGVFVTEDDIGTGSIIGSSCFNLIAVPAACAFVASATFTRKLSISPIPVIRNSAFYAITILVLLLIIKDNKVDIPEAIILFLFFVMYMAFMIVCAQSRNKSDGSSMQNSLNNSCISNDSAIAECGKDKWQYNKIGQDDDRGQERIYGKFYFDTSKMKLRDDSDISSINKLVSTGNEECTPLVGTNTQKAYTILRPQNDYVNQSLFGERQRNNENNSSHLVSCSIDVGLAVKNSACLMKSTELPNHLDDSHEDGWLNSLWVLVPLFPLTLSLKILTPLKFKNTCWTIWTFIVSIALIGALTYVSVWMVQLFGKAVGLPETVAGMTILSWGTGIPELIASIVLIKKTAQADMAICNTIGSNVIDASFCLSLPWLIKCFMNKADGGDPEVAVQSAALPWTTFTLLLTVVILISVLKLHNWELSFSVGIWLMVTYCAFVSVATYLESTYSKSGFDPISMM